MVYLTYAHKPEITAARERANRCGWGPEELRWIRAAGDRAGAELARGLERNATETTGTAAATVVNAGFAGALDKSLGTGQVVIVEHFLTDSRLPEQPEAEALSRVAKVLAAACAWPSVGGITVAEPVLDASRRAQLHQQTGAAIVDMEGFHLARTARAFGLDFVCLKVVSDRADEAAWNSTVGEASRWSRILGEAIERLLEQLYDRTDSARD